MNAILAINSGSSSLKFRLASVDGENLFWGSATRLGTKGALLAWHLGDVKSETIIANAGHGDIVSTISEYIANDLPKIEIVAVGHRIVHGGMEFGDPVIIQGDALGRIRELEPLAPLHQPAGIKGIELAMIAFPNALQVAVFDTGFHSEKPWLHDSYALNAEHYDAGIRRYGFHGISCQSVMRQLVEQGINVQYKRIIIAHLGNGCSVTAVKYGKAHATSMGFSTLDGVAMGTRPGHIDAGVLIHWMREGRRLEDIERELYHASGLLGLSGISNDIRDLMSSNDPRAANAIAFFTARISEEIARMATTMSGLDMIAFCGGIGENASSIREAIQGQIAFLSPIGAVDARVVQTDEEGEIILRAKALL